MFRKLFQPKGTQPENKLKVVKQRVVTGDETINILTKNRNVIDIADASDLPTIKALSNIVKKYYVCWGKNVSLQ